MFGPIKMSTQAAAQLPRREVHCLPVMGIIAAHTQKFKQVVCMTVGIFLLVYR